MSPIDPDEAYLAIRSAIRDWNAWEDLGNTDLRLEAAGRLVESFEALDGWMKSGGFAPRPWQDRETIWKGVPEDES